MWGSLFISDRLYFATLKAGYKPKSTRNSKYFHIEDEIVYENFYFDFGPYHLCHLYQFCNKLTEELEKNPKKKVVFYTSNNVTLRLNAAYLIGSYQVRVEIAIILLGYSLFLLRLLIVCHKWVTRYEKSR